MKKADPAYTVLARRYRPTTFDEVVGQEHVAQTLRNAIRENRVGHAYLFTGPRGVGKTSSARLLAKALNCSKGISTDPCNECGICANIQEGTDTDVIEMDAASNRGVEDARSLREGVRYAPLGSRHKIYIIDEAHMLTREAFNTLLKTLEEPPPHVKFIFATTEPHKIPDTITSRCQRFDFRRVTAADIVRRLRQVVSREKLEVADEVLGSCARAARGSMRDAESVLDQLLAFKEKGLTPADVSALLGAAPEDRLEALVMAMKAGDPGTVLATLDGVFAGGIDPAAFTDQVIDHVRVLMLLKACGRQMPGLDLPDHAAVPLEKQAAAFSIESLLYFMQLLFEARRRIREGMHPRIVLEVTAVKMAKAADLVTLAEAIRAVESSPLQRPAIPAAPPVSAPPPPAPPPPKPDVPEPETAEDIVEETTAPSGSLPEVQAAWNRVVALAKEASILPGTLLSEGRPIRLTAGVIDFQLPSKFARLNVEQLETPKNKAIVEGALQKVFGKRLAMKVSLEGGGSAATARPAAPSNDLAGDPRVRMVLEKFPGSRVDRIE